MQIIRIAFTWLQGHFISRLYEALHVDKIHEQFNYECATRSSLPADRFHTETSGCFAFTCYRLRNFVPEWYSRSGTTTGVSSRQCDSRRYGILCWYHVNKYRATRGNRSELAPARKSSRCHVNAPWNTFYCENGRQASQIRGFTKQNLNSNHEHKALPTRIRTFFENA